LLREITTTPTNPSDTSSLLTPEVIQDVQFVLYQLRQENAWEFVAIQNPPLWPGHDGEQDDTLSLEDTLHMLEEQLRQQPPAVGINISHLLTHLTFILVASIG
jgi:hypothetical protein